MSSISEGPATFEGSTKALRYSADIAAMPKISVDVPQELLDDMDEHVGDEGKFVNRSDAIRSSMRKMLDVLDEIDERHGRLEHDE